MSNPLTIPDLVKMAGENSRDHGFHDDWPLVFEGDDAASNRDYQKAITEKLDLIHEEVSEALGEIRSGHDARHVYYSTKIKLDPFQGYLDSTSRHEVRTFAEQDYELVDDAFPGGPSKPVLKPEGFGVELADAVIRIADLAYLTGIDLEALIREKHQYNATRPYKHGRKF